MRRIDARVLAPRGHAALSTAPYLSFAAAYLPRLKIPVPLHLHALISNMEYVLAGA